MRTRSLIASLVAGLIAIAVLAVPTKVVCPNGPCSTAPDAHGNVHRYYQMKPLGVTLLENVTELRIPIHYTSGADAEPLK